MYLHTHNFPDILVQAKFRKFPYEKLYFQYHKIVNECANFFEWVNENHSSVNKR